MRYILGCLCVLALGVMGCSETSGTVGSGGIGGVGGGAGGTGKTYDFAAVDSAAAAFIDAFGMEGLTLAVVRQDEGKIYEKGYGEFDSDRISLIASTTKVLSAGVILTLVDDGILELDKPVAEYLGWGDYHPDVTMEQLLSMMSGIKGLPLPEPYHPCVSNPDATLQECGREVFEDETTSVPPGDEFRYSAGAWQLAAAVAEVVSGKSWEALMNEKLLQPCGLHDTGMGSVGPLPDLYPDWFQGDPANLGSSENPQVYGGGYTTVDDYSKVLLMHLHDGRCGQVSVLSSEMVQRMQEDHVPEGVSLPPSFPVEAVNYGMGWWRYEDDSRLLVDSGRWGARAVLHPDEGWGAILIIEHTSVLGTFMYREIVPLIREAVLAADQTL